MVLVREVMTPNPVTVQVDSPIRRAAGLLRKYHIGGLPVMEGDRVAGIVTETDIISLLDVGDISSDLWLPSPLEVIEVPYGSSSTGRRPGGLSPISAIWRSDR